MFAFIVAIIMELMDYLLSTLFGTKSFNIIHNIFKVKNPFPKVNISLSSKNEGVRLNNMKISSNSEIL